MSNSPLVNYTKISLFKNSPRNHKIDKITIHHMAGNFSVETCGNIFTRIGRNGSSNYGIGSDGRVGLYVPESDRAWTSGSRENDHRAVTIEVANDGGAPSWHVSDKAYAKLLDLCVDICKRNGISRLNFTGNASGNLTMHKYFQATACPGPYLESRFPEIAAEVNRRLNGEVKPVPKAVSVVYQVYANGRWLPNVIDRTDYAGNFGQSASGLYASAEGEPLFYRVAEKNGRWLPEVRDRRDYAGNLGKPFDRVMVRAASGRTVHVQAHVGGKLFGRWLPAVTGYDVNDHKNGYAGNKGQAIDGLYIWME